MIKRMLLHMFIARVAEYLLPKRQEVIMTESLMWMMTRSKHPARSWS